MNKKHMIGHIGEQEIIALVYCPNCKKKLMQLPINYPVYDLQCTGCIFRAQVKTSNSQPKAEIFGAGWQIIDKILKAGYLMPPLIVNFKWNEQELCHQKIIFYPFVAKTNIKKKQLSATTKRANYKMFNYIGLDTLPHFVLFEK